MLFYVELGNFKNRFYMLYIGYSRPTIYGSVGTQKYLKLPHNPKGEVVVNDSTVYCQSHRTDRSIFSAEKIQDRWFKVSAAASVGAFASQRCPPDTRTLPYNTKQSGKYKTLPIVFIFYHQKWCYMPPRRRKYPCYNESSK